MELLDMEKLENALFLVNRMADGKNPLNDNPYEENSVLNDPTIIRCMFFVKDVLTSVKENGGVLGKKKRTPDKEFPIDSLESFSFTGEKTITKFVEQLNEKIDPDEFKKLKYKTITDWLKYNDYLEEKDDKVLGKRVTLTTSKGNAVGISHSLQTSLSGTSYYRIVYNREAQEFLIKTLPEMVA